MDNPYTAFAQALHDRGVTDLARPHVGAVVVSEPKVVFPQVNGAAVDRIFRRAHGVEAVIQSKPPQVLYAGSPQTERDAATKSLVWGRNDW